MIDLLTRGLAALGIILMILLVFITFSDYEKATDMRERLRDSLNHKYPRDVSRAIEKAQVPLHSASLVGNWSCNTKQVYPDGSFLTGELTVQYSPDGVSTSRGFLSLSDIDTDSKQVFFNYAFDFVASGTYRVFENRTNVLEIMESIDRFNISSLEIDGIDVLNDQDMQSVIQYFESSFQGLSAIATILSLTREELIIEDTENQLSTCTRL